MTHNPKDNPTHFFKARNIGEEGPSQWEVVVEDLLEHTINGVMMAIIDQDDDGQLLITLTERLK